MGMWKRRRLTNVKGWHRTQAVWMPTDSEAASMMRQGYTFRRLCKTVIESATEANKDIDRIMKLHLQSE